MKVIAIVPAAGHGLRMGKKTPKPYILLSGTPILIHTLKMLDASHLIDGIIVVVNSSFIKKTKDLIKKYKLNKINKIISGGRLRSESVYNGLCAVDEKAEFILIHDSVRPFLTEELIKRTIFGSRRFGACICAVPVKPTVKEIDKNGFVKRTLDRKDIWEIQTPQVFRKDLIQQAYKKFKNIDATDDSILVEKLGARVKVVLGSYSNIKITTPEDLVIAESILKNVI